ncbi:MAG: TolC family protein [Bacteroides sp.]|nr:TolC family protein [Bacteroides sp.]
MNIIRYSSLCLLLTALPSALCAHQNTEGSHAITLTVPDVDSNDKSSGKSEGPQMPEATNSSNAEKWSFDDCLKWALANNTDVRRNTIRLLLAQESVGEAKDAWLPNVGFNTSQSFINYPAKETGRDGNTYTSSYGVDASWTVWEGNIRKYKLESAKLLEQQEALAGADTEKEIKLGVLQAYLNIMYAVEAVEIAQQTLEVSEAQTERALKLMNAGRTSKVDFAQIESQCAQDRYNLVQAQGNLESAKVNLKTILQITLDQDFDIHQIECPDSVVLTQLPPMVDTYNIAAAWLPQIKSNELNKDLYANDIKIAKAGYMPQIALSGGIGTGYTSGGKSWGNQMGHGFNERIGVNISVPIYDGNATRRATAKAKIAAEQYEVDRDDLLNSLSQTIENLYTEANNAKAKFIAGLKQLEATSLTSTLVDRQFELGLVNPLELLTAHNNLLTARLELLQSKYMAILSNKTINFYASQEVNLP